MQIKTIFFILLFLPLTICGQVKSRTFSKNDIQDFVVEITSQLKEIYVFPGKVLALSDGIQTWALGLPPAISWTGEVAADSLTRAMHLFIDDEHLRVRYNPQKPVGKERGRPSTQEMFAMLNSGFMEVSFVGEGIGYLDLRAFDPSPTANQKAESAFQLLQDAKGLIIDLRNNIGGSVLMVQRLCSYLIKDNVKLNTIYNRLENSTTDFWTLSDSVLTRVGKEKPIYLLTSHRTFSGGEEFAYNLKHLKRATLVGEKTRGGAHPTRPFPISDGMLLFIPFARSINPVTGTNWEGVGVKPHIEIPADDALEKAKELITNDLAKKTNG